MLFSGCVFPAGGENEDSGSHKESGNDSEDDRDDLERIAGGGSNVEDQTGEKSFPPPAGMKSLFDFTVFFGKTKCPL